MEQRIRSVFKRMSEAHEPFCQCVSTATLEALVASSRYDRISHSNTVERHQSLVDSASARGQHGRNRTKKKRRKKNKLGANPHPGRVRFRILKSKRVTASTSWNVFGIELEAMLASRRHQNVARVFTVFMVCCLIYWLINQWTNPSFD